MASYYDDSASPGSLAAWYSNIDEQNALQSPRPHEQMSSHCYLGRQLEWDAWQQAFDVRPTTPNETLGVDYRHVISDAEVGFGAEYSGYLGTIEDATNYYDKLSRNVVWHDSQHSPVHTAAAPTTFIAQHIANEAATEHVDTRLSVPIILDRRPVEIANTSFEHQNDPSPSENGLVPRRQDPRFPGDEYTARWIRGDRLERAGWCSRCSSWHKLKDSAYWYHMHYSHGISCMTGKSLDLPAAWRSAQGAIGYEALCGGCKQWVVVGRAERWRTPYFRHAYKCQVKNNPTLRRAQSRSKSTSPRKATARPSKFR